MVREVLDELLELYDAGLPFAIATVVGVRGSAPRTPGAVMAVDAAGEVFGSVSGGCVEGAVYDVALEVLRTGRPEHLTYGISDDAAFAVGLTCGGIIEVLVQRIDPRSDHAFKTLLDAVREGKPVARVIVVDGGAELAASVVVTLDGCDGSLGAVGLDAAVVEDVRGMLEQGGSGQLSYGANGERLGHDVSMVAHCFTPPPRLLVFGVTEFSVAVVELGVMLGYRVTVCDARPVFASAKRFPRAHEVIRQWPHQYLERTEIDARTVICVLTHDPKFETPLLTVALRTKAAYVGAMGSRRSHADRIRRLREAGLTDVELARLHSPIGLDLGARTTEETALSIAAEVLLERTGASGLPLRDVAGPIHAAFEGARA